MTTSSPALPLEDMVSAADIDAAADRLATVAVRTPLMPSERLSEATGATVWLKREDLQPVRSYKLRGAYNLIAQLSETQRSAGVVCASAGNHAQGLAFACRLLGIDGHAFVPRTTPWQKRDRVLALGHGRVQVHAVGDTYDEASEHAVEFAATTGAAIVPAFDAPAVIAGQATVTREIEEQLGRIPDVLVLPVGGGGLLAGAIAATRGRDLRLVGVEPAGAASMAAAVAAGRPVPLDQLDTFVDGAAVRQVGAHTFAQVAGGTANLALHTVAEGALCTELVALYQTEGIIAEPAGALASTVLEQLADLSGQQVVCVLSGGNNDLTRYAEILERSLVDRGLKHYFLVEFPQEPGALRGFLDHALGPDDDITLFDYVKRSNRETGPALVGIELARRADLAPLLARIADLSLMVEQVQPDHPLFRFVQ